MSRRFEFPILLLVMSLMPALVQAADEKATTRPSAVEAYAPYIGEWHINAKWSDGGPLEARGVYEWGLNRKFIIARTFVKKPEGGEYQRYESIFADDAGKLVMYAFTYTGEAHVRPMTVEGRVIHNTWSVAGKEGPVNLRQSTELLDDSHFRWQVSVQGKDGQWNTMMDGIWQRIATAAAK